MTKTAFDIETPAPKPDPPLNLASIKLSLQDTGVSSTVQSPALATQDEKPGPRCDGTLEDVTDEYLRDNEYIKTGYRIHFQSIWDVGRTLFRVHNETFNVWSHLLGVIAFLALIGVVLLLFPNMEKVAFVKDVTWENNDAFAEVASEIRLADLELQLLQASQISNATEETLKEKKALLEQSLAAAEHLLDKAEQSAYVIVRQTQQHVRSDYEQNQPTFSAEATKQMIGSLQQKLEQFSSAIASYFKASAVDKRLAVLRACLQSFHEAIDELNSKIGTWIENPPLYRTQVLGSLEPSLVLTYVARWPLIVHLLSACFCLGSSALFHLFHVHSKTVNDVLSRLDYGGISILIMGSSYPPIFYSLACHQVQTARNWFMILITVTSTGCFISTMHPAMNKPRFRAVRGFMFIILGCSAGFPLLYASLADPKYTNYQGALQFALGGATYIVGALFYVFRIPERWFPGTFDLAFSSHNIFHLFVVAGCAIHFDEALNLYHSLREKVCPVDFPL